MVPAAGIDPPDRRIIGPIRRPNQHGVYRARVEIWDPGLQQWVTKKAHSTFFHDDWTPAQIEAAIQRAYANCTLPPGGAASPSAYQFQGDGGHGFEIKGYYDNGVITTAYPVYVQ